MLSIILPTFNEAENITTLIQVLDGVLQGKDHEIIVVDDNSPDGTWHIVQETVKSIPTLRVIRRIGKRGLSSAVVEGFDAARGDVLAVMDADGQHDTELILRLLGAIQDGADLAIGSRYVAGGSVGEWVRDRRIISKTGTMVANRISQAAVSDPLGGFFMLRTPLYRSFRHKLKPTGFKILLEILANIPPGTRIKEIPLIFRMRRHGRSKLSLRVQFEFVFQVVRLTVSRIIGYKSLSFAFAIAVCIVTAATLPRAWALRLLSTDAAVRSKTQAALNAVSLREGWRLSDISLVAVSRDRIDIRYQEHLLTPQPSIPCVITLTATFPLSCVERF
ncbi:MAG: polyprenol monophosphomannose synthase [Candidatus Peribacteraceae bacterium]|nr:polyprenol monophosphomannose synthase [Candidatus Peribacteraceae bacterium]